jgi:site-specific recombinase XerD
VGSNPSRDAINQSCLLTGFVNKWLETFIASRKGETGITPKGERWLRQTLGSFLKQFPNPIEVTRQDIEGFLAGINRVWYKHSHFRAIRAFYNWLDAQGYIEVSPCHRMKAPKLPQVVLSHPSYSQIRELIANAATVRDKAIISLFADTGMRLSELARIKPDMINWQSNTIKIIGKGRKERIVKFSSSTGSLISQHLSGYTPNGNIWGINANGIATMLKRLGKQSGIKANPHSFRRAFAIELRKRGTDSLTVQYLGGWESLAMVERYSRAAKQEIALAEYIPLTQNMGT